MLKSKIEEIISSIQTIGKYPKECDVDYKVKLNIHKIKNEDVAEDATINNSNLDIFLSNFFVDILSFANGDGGVILLGFDEDKKTGVKVDTGLTIEDLKLLESVDLGELSDKILSFTKVSIELDLQEFQVVSRKFYYLLIEKSNQTLISNRDEKKYRLSKGEIIYRKNGKNYYANSSSAEMDSFILRKSNEKSKEYLDLWRELLPSMIDISPKDILIINPKEGLIFGFGKELIKLKLDLDTSSKSGFGLMLNTIQADQIGNISQSGEKPIFRMIGNISLINEKIIEKERSDKITITSAIKEITKRSCFNLSSVDFKKICHYLKITSENKFPIQDCKKFVVNENIILKSDYLFISIIDSSTDRKKIYTTKKCIEEFSEAINTPQKQQEIFGKLLNKNSEDLKS